MIDDARTDDALTGAALPDAALTGAAPSGDATGDPLPASVAHVREPLDPEHPHETFALEVRGLSAGYPGQPLAITDVDLRVPAGEIVGLIGPNGAGKSTLFKTVLGLLKPTSGEVLAFGRPLRDARSEIAYMPQVEEVDWDFPVSVLDVVLMGRYRGMRPWRLRSGWSKADRASAMAAIDRVGLGGTEQRQVGQLSGGQRRRVLMARAIARGARLMLLDEPFAGLDATVQHDLLAILDELAAEGRSVLVATHDLSCVANSCDEACCLNRTVIASGPPAEVLTADVLSRTFRRHLLSVSEHGALQIAQDEHLTGGGDA